MSLDPITLEVLRNKFDVIADEMQIALLRSAYSMNIKEANDATCALLTPAGEIVAQAVANPGDIGAIMPAVQTVLRKFPVAGMAEGDVYVINDPYGGGSHLPDVFVVVPICYRGQVELVAGVKGHEQDIGGKSPGSVPTDSTEIYQEGLCLPALKMYDRGEPNETLLAILRKNVRVSDIVLGDIHSQISAGRVGHNRMQDVFETYGVETVRAAMSELLDRAESMTREYISALPDGDYSFVDYLDNDGVELDRSIPIRCTIRIRGTEATFDYAGSGAQAKGPVNSVPSNALPAAYYWLKAVTDASIPSNGGIARLITLDIPEGTVVNPRHPAPVAGRGATMLRTNDVVHGALVKLLPEAVPAGACGQTLFVALAGTKPDGQPFVTCDLGAGGAGARHNQDGIDVLEVGIGNTMNVPCEAFEQGVPLRIAHFELRQDSGGPGRFRGGLGSHKVFEALTEVKVSMRGERYFTQPWGVYGGLAAASGQGWVIRRDGTRLDIPSKMEIVLQVGDRMHLLTPGGGGHGDPLERDPDAVLLDVQDEKVSLAAARDIYGVAVSDDGMTHYPAETERLRAQLRQSRPAGEQPVFDHGALGRSHDGTVQPIMPQALLQRR